MILSQELTEQHYNPETGDYDGQLVSPDLVSQLSPPTLKPKVFDRMAWADSVVQARRYRGSTAAVFHRQTVRAATEEGCFESVGSMAAGLGISRSSVQRAIKTISKDGYMVIEERSCQSYLCHPDFGKGVSGGVSLVTPPPGVSLTPKGKPSSSKGKEKRKDDELVDLKRVGGPGPEHGVTDRGLKPFFQKKKGPPRCQR